MFGNKLKELRKNAKITQEDLGQKLNVSKNTISYWESGAYQPPIETIIEISKIFNVSTDYLFGIENLSKEEKLIKALTEVGIYVNSKDITLEDLTNALQIVSMLKDKKDTK